MHLKVCVSDWLLWKLGYLLSCLSVCTSVYIQVCPCSRGRDLRPSLNCWCSRSPSVNADVTHLILICYFDELLVMGRGKGISGENTLRHTHKYTLTHIGCVYRGTTSTKAFLILQFCPLPPSFTGSFCCSELFLLLCTHLISYIKKIIFSSLLLRGARINKLLWQMHVSFDASLTHTCDLLPPANMGDSACGLCTVCVTTRIAMCVCVCCSINTVGGMVACAG